MQRFLWDKLKRQAKEFPDSVAIYDVHGLEENVNITYAALKTAVERLGTEIAERSAPGSLVALDVMTPAAAAIAMLAATSAGRAFMPLNGAFPPSMRQTVLADARPTLLLTQVGRDAVRVGYVASEGNWLPRNDMEGIAYILYTSGTTGQPKGVLISAAALEARLNGLAVMPGLQSDDVIMAFTAISFDISLAEILLPLYVGAALVSIPRPMIIDLQKVIGIINQFQPNIIQATPSFWHILLASAWKGYSKLRIWCGGEALTPALANRLLSICGELWNVYGPTEATIWAMASHVLPGTSISLGEPLPGSGLLLEDEYGNQVTATARQGELLLYGSGIAERYLNREQLTKNRFIRRTTPEGEKLCYRTGDLAQFRADGTLEYCGRVDHQVKLRGYRIELGGVEAVLEECPGVGKAVVLVGAADDPERAHLVAFLVLDEAVSIKLVREWVARRLPREMCPSRILQKKELPRTSAGKVDRMQLASDL